MHGARSRIFDPGIMAFPHDDLPIARIGLSQPHGVMIVADARSRVIEHVSANIATILSIDPMDALGRDVASLFDDKGSHQRFDLAAPNGAVAFNNPVMLETDGGEFEAVMHIHAGKLFVEIEAYIKADRDYPTMVAEATEKLAAQRSVHGLNRAAVDLLQEVSGYDRVMLYRFESSGHGQVIAERCVTEISFDQLWFPASDVPAEARRVLLHGKTRYTPSVTRPGSPMLTLSSGQLVESGQAIDMTHAWLRGVHDCHNGYMTHIATHGSMVFPVMVDDHLWGLFVCHNNTEKYINYDSRVVIEQMTMMYIAKLIELEEIEARIEIREGQMRRMVDSLRIADGLMSSLGGQQSVDRSSVHLETLAFIARQHANLTQLMVGTELLANGDGRALSTFETDLLSFVGADSAAILRSGQVRLIGEAPDALSVLAVSNLFGSALPDLTDGQNWKVFATASLPSLLPIAETMKARGCGVLAVPLDQAGHDILFWFRKETVIDALWAGKPPSREELEFSRMDKPRSSFGRHHAPIENMAVAWTERDVMMANDFGAELRATYGHQSAAYSPTQRLMPPVETMRPPAPVASYQAPAAMDPPRRKAGVIRVSRA